MLPIALDRRGAATWIHRIHRMDEMRDLLGNLS
jgi:hypothetical protein